MLVVRLSYTLCCSRNIRILSTSFPDPLSIPVYSVVIAAAFNASVHLSGHLLAIQLLALCHQICHQPSRWDLQCSTASEAGFVACGFAHVGMQDGLL